MPVSLSKVHRKLLENTTAAARVLAELACKAALENLAVHEKDYRAHMSVEQRVLRNRLRARGRALGDKRDERTGIQGMYHLTELAAYEHWHRLLFTRFLTENHLLITDEAHGSVPITLEECEELAEEMGARDGFDLACRFASITLPGVFRRDDPVLDLPIAINDQVELRKLLAKLTSDCFTADDSLGWTYQFWQAQRKDEVNRSGKKIGADELSPVTQLFTEDYMVEFLLHNTLGAWWAGKLGPIQADSEAEARAQAALVAHSGVPAIAWTYLRFVQDETAKTWLPAAGTFDGWPKTANLIRLLDPCMGSGHFLAFALPLLVRMRMEEEQFDATEAVVAVLKDNIHGLELDERCTQIAAFNVALTAWKLVGYQALPPLHLACSGLAPRSTEAEWVALAGIDERLQRGMMRLYSLFKEASMFGSLISPHVAKGNLLEAGFLELQPLLERALAQETKDDTTHELVVTAYGLAKAAEILSSQFTLVATNVPFLGGYKQCPELAQYLSKEYEIAGGNLANAVLVRLFEFLQDRMTVAVVTPLDWMLLGRYEPLRENVLTRLTGRALAYLGTRAFETIEGEVVTTGLSIWEKVLFEDEGYSDLLALDAQVSRTPTEKALVLSAGGKISRKQSEWISNPGSRITVESISASMYLSKFGRAWQGIKTSDDDRFVTCFWEHPKKEPKWRFYVRSMSVEAFSGREHLLLWEEGRGQLRELSANQSRDRKRDLQGMSAWGKVGVAINTAGRIVAGLYLGEAFASEVVVLITKPELVGPVLAFTSSPQFANSLKKLDKRVSITTSTFSQVPFELSRWQAASADNPPHGLATPSSSDPRQWLFDGRPRGSDQPLHVAVARLLCYCWPRQTGSSFPDCPALGSDGLEDLTDRNGIVCLPPLNREQPAANRLRQLLTAALGAFDERSLIARAGLKGSKSKTMEEWLRDEFFEQHARLFHDRPFIWHLWDGCLDGFHALVNYHRLDHAALQKLTYSYLGNWIQQQSEDAKADKPGAAARLGAAQALQKKLAAILEGQPPLDIFVRWKPLKDQVQGWHPDLNDGIRQNIRPFLKAGDVGKRGAGLFRAIPLKLKDDDRGSEPHRPITEYPWFWCEDEPGTDPVGGKEFVGKRWNNVHLTLEKKRNSKA